MSEMPARVSALDWLSTSRWYLVGTAALNLVWESGHLPLYTIWWDKALNENLFATWHCTLGDVVLAGTTLSIALAIVGRSDWPLRWFIPVAVVAMALGGGAAVYLERLNTRSWRNWAYSELMPIIPWVEVGVSPVLQWIALPPIALLAARWMAGRP